VHRGYGTSGSPGVFDDSNRHDIILAFVGLAYSAMCKISAMELVWVIPVSGMTAK
jgi:hypothetical protein